MKAIVVFGGGGHAKVVTDAIEREGKFKIEGIVNPRGKTGDKWLDRYQIISYEEALSVGVGVIAIGDNADRKYQSELVIRSCPSYVFVNVIHPSAMIGRDVIMGYGNVILAGAIINSSTVFGNHTIVNTGAIVEHDCSLDDYAFIAPNATLGGGSVIGEATFIGIGAMVKQGTRIGRNTLIGMGSVLTKDIEENLTAFGNPAKVISKRQIGQRFF